jgi:glutathione S-transferase
MIELVGMLDSPFVRRVAIALVHYQMPFTLNPLSVYSNTERLAAINPLLTVPVLRLENRQILDSRRILAWLDKNAAIPLLPCSDHLQEIAAITDFAALKSGEIYRERILRDVSIHSFAMQKRIAGQIYESLALIESKITEAGQLHEKSWELSHGSIAIYTAYQFVLEISQAFALLLPPTPKLHQRCAHLEKAANLHALTSP